MLFFYFIIEIGHFSSRFRSWWSWGKIGWLDSLIVRKKTSKFTASPKRATATHHIWKFWKIVPNCHFGIILFLDISTKIACKNATKTCRNELTAVRRYLPHCPKLPYCPKSPHCLKSLLLEFCISNKRSHGRKIILEPLPVSLTSLYTTFFSLRIT